MSYDIHAAIDPAPNRFVTVMDLEGYTSNVAPMWRAACPELDGLADIDGKSGKEVSERLRAGQRRMFLDRRELEKLNDEDGWGDFPGAFRYFSRITRFATQHPDAVFHVSR